MSAFSPVKFILCADDFGLSTGVSRGILDLVEQRRLSATGCMMTQPGLREAASDLLSQKDRLDIGVHLVLTDQPALSPETGILPPLGSLVRMALTHRLPIAAIREELERQLEAFVDLFNRRPDFVDGHHHIHHLPGIREILLDLLEQRFAPKLPALRCCDERLSTVFHRRIAPLKAILVGLPGRNFRRLALARGFHLNNGFSGIYDLSGKIPYDVLFDRFTEELLQGALVMCHPGRVDEGLRAWDSLTDQREIELAYFLSDDFLALLQRKNLRLGRFPP